VTPGESVAGGFVSDHLHVPKTAMICYGYAFEVSPTLNNICSYLFDKDGRRVDLYLDRMRRGQPADFPHVTIVDVESRDLLKRLLGGFMRFGRRVLCESCCRRAGRL